MKLKKAGIFFLAAILTSSLTGCQFSVPFTKEEAKEVLLKNTVPTNKISKSHIVEPNSAGLSKKLLSSSNISNSLQDKIKKFLLSNKVNGSVVVIRDKKTILDEGFGYSSIEKKIFNQAQTTYPIASITKTFVATSVMQLQEKGKLNINDPLSKYIPDFPNGNKIKLIYLLSHRSGIQKPKWHKGDTTPEALVKEIEKRPLLFQPGTQWDYKDANYMILGYILEKVTGTSLHDYIQKNIFNKAGMKHSGFITRQYPKLYTSTGYILDPVRMYPLGISNPYMLYGCGDIYTTAHDLSLYDQTLMKGDLVSMKSLEEIEKPLSSSHYGLGLYNNGSVISSRGVLGGWESLHLYFKDKTSIVLLLNERHKKSDIYKISDEILHLVRS
ncbi:MAG: serine hydrolase domain-containing protein [Bacillota bacterium]|nr:serine hydrolase domain-containing protein [Bacillota bacterium]